MCNHVPCGDTIFAKPRQLPSLVGAPGSLAWLEYNGQMDIRGLWKGRVWGCQQGSNSEMFIVER